MKNLVVIEEEELLRKMEVTFLRCFNASLKHVNSLSKEESSKKEDHTYLSKKGAAKLAGVSCSTIDNWIRAGRIEKYKFGGAVRIKKAKLVEFLESTKGYQSE